jgi:hypothetical protein
MRVTIMASARFYLIPATVLLVSMLHCSGLRAETIIETTNGSRVFLPTVVAPDYASSSVRIERSAVPSTTVTTITEGPLMGKENFARRLQLMKEQLDKGISNGWIGPVDAVSLNARYADMLGQLQANRFDNLPYDQAQSMERQLNGFNIDLSRRMSTASTGNIQ